MLCAAKEWDTRSRILEQVLSDSGRRFPRYAVDKISGGGTERNTILIEIKEFRRDFLRDITRSAFLSVEGDHAQGVIELPLGYPIEDGCFVRFPVAHFSPDRAIAANLIEQEVGDVFCVWHDAVLHQKPPHAYET